MRSFLLLTFLALTISSSFAMAQQFVTEAEEKFGITVICHGIESACDTGKKVLLQLDANLPVLQKLKGQRVRLILTQSGFSTPKLASHGGALNAVDIEIDTYASVQSMRDFLSQIEPDVSLILEIQAAQDRLNTIFDNVYCWSALSLNQCKQGLDNLLDNGYASKRKQLKRLRLVVYTVNGKPTMRGDASIKYDNNPRSMKNHIRTLLGDLTLRDEALKLQEELRLKLINVSLLNTTTFVPEAFQLTQTLDGLKEELEPLMRQLPRVTKIFVGNSMVAEVTPSNELMIVLNYAASKEEILKFVSEQISK